VLPFLATRRRLRQSWEQGQSTNAAEPVRSLFEFNQVGAVINAHGTKLTEENPRQQGVKVHLKHLFQFIQVHHRDLLRSPEIPASSTSAGRRKEYPLKPAPPRRGGICCGSNRALA